ncbi:MAG: hypothetical protein C4526_11735 [Nitrospiraceae bacterium]|nr:MAG: hypothetical protein C4526_11735 [Nitrospiraceae bacterium]
MKILLVLFLILTGCAGIQEAVFTPSGIEQYCRKISGNSDAESLNTCIRQEESAKHELSRMTVPPQVDKRCRQLSESTGGSYQVMLTCVKDKMPLNNKGKYNKTGDKNMVR